MHRRQFLLGMLAISVTPTPAFARRKTRFFSEKKNKPDTRTIKYGVVLFICGVATIAAVGKLVTKMIDRLVQRQQDAIHLPPVNPSAAPATSDIPAKTLRGPGSAPVFGRRTR